MIQGVPDGVIITQLHHTQWQSKNTLPSTASVLKLIDNLIKTQMGTGNNAITVVCRYLQLKLNLTITFTVVPKCSDGIGRTGTFICIYSQLERLKAEGVVDVFQSVKASRLQRPLVVTNTVRWQQNCIQNLLNIHHLGTICILSSSAGRLSGHL